MSKREILIVGCLAVAVFLLAVLPAVDLDFWWHLAVGRLHVEQHLFPRTDPFSHTATNLFWDDKEWLFGIIMYSVYKMLGINGAILFKALLVAATFTVVYFTSRRFSSSPLISSLLALVAALSSRITFTERPWLFTALFEALFLLIIYKARAGSPRLLWLLPVLMVPWVNLHPAAIIGIAVIGAFVFEVLVEEIRKRAAGFFSRILHDPYEWTLIAVGLVTPVTYLITPNTTFRYTAVYELFFKHTKFITSLEETTPASFFQDPYFYLLLGLSAGLLLYFNRKTAPSDVVLLLCTGYLAVKWQRNVPIFSVACVPFLARSLQSALLADKRSRFKIWHDSHRAKLEWGGIAALALISVIITRSEYFGLGLGANRFPEEATEYILSNGLKGNLYNIYNWGGYHIFRMYPEYKVFIDGRGPDAYTPEIWHEYEQIRDGSSEYGKLLDKHNVEIVFISTADRLQNLIARLNSDPGWGCVFRDYKSAVYVRSGSSNMRVANESNWKNAAIESMNKGEYVAALGYVNHLKSLNPADVEPWFNAGIICGRYLKRYDEAIENFKKVISLDAHNVDARVNLASLYQKKGDKQGAIGLLKEALELDPSNETIKVALDALQK